MAKMTWTPPRSAVVACGLALSLVLGCGSERPALPVATGSGPVRPEDPLPSEPTDGAGAARDVAGGRLEPTVPDPGSTVMTNPGEASPEETAPAAAHGLDAGSSVLPAAPVPGEPDAEVVAPSAVAMGGSTASVATPDGGETKASSDDADGEFVDVSQAANEKDDEGSGGPDDPVPAAAENVKPGPEVLVEEDPEATARREAEDSARRALEAALAATTGASAGEDEGLAAAGGAASSSVDHAAFDAILRATVRNERVDYRAIQARHRSALDAYLRSLATVDHAALPDEDRLAFFINLYNATMIQAVLDRLDDEWTPAADSFAVFDAPLVELGGARVSLNHLEHEIIRKSFEDPRIHVALVCAARSCPPLLDRAWQGSTLDETLEQRMRAFLASGFRNRIDRRQRKLHLSKLFEWYAADFGGPDRIASYVDRYVEGDVADYAVEYIEYRWDLNIVR